MVNSFTRNGKKVENNRESFFLPLEESPWDGFSAIDKTRNIKNHLAQFVSTLPITLSLEEKERQILEEYYKLKASEMFL